MISRQRMRSGSTSAKDECGEEHNQFLEGDGSTDRVRGRGAEPRQLRGSTSARDVLGNLIMGANGLDRERRVKEACRVLSARNQVELNTNAEPELALAA